MRRPVRRYLVKRRGAFPSVAGITSFSRPVCPAIRSVRTGSVSTCSLD